MNIIKAVRLLHDFIENNENEIIGANGENFDRLFIHYLRQHHFKTQNVSFYLHLARVKEFILFDDQAATIGEAFEVSKEFTDYVIKNDAKKRQFLYGLIGSLCTIVGGIVGALIAVFA